LFISLLHFGIKNKKWRYVKNKYVDTRALNSGLVYGSVIACAVMCIIKYITSLALTNFGFRENEDNICDSLTDSTYDIYALVLFFVYFYLWSRQRAFYANQILNVNYNKLIKLFSYSLNAFVFVYVIFVVCYHTVPKLYISSKKGCI